MNLLPEQIALKRFLLLNTSVRNRASQLFINSVSHALGDFVPLGDFAPLALGDFAPLDPLALGDFVPLGDFAPLDPLALG
eukprot:CAMPEP_0113539256 /NCGR_PEP_ID=MMETSP0015_2-20120614/7817_1 /TAXON_ID=2838 /ORGANISM="Odontella" /LENGTH=79 /DNA_ID=CAMNT_0000438915 /DNA_START=375 /DNA_END=610 /DNA_ORIENTATION=+ /assembly_acc=CAM_ASM_000160